MQFKTLALSAFVAAAAAQSLQEVVKEMPACAQKCVDEASPKIGCPLNDNKCQCGKIEDLTKSALPCISSGCKPEEMQVAMKVSTQICSIVASGGADTKSSAPTFSNSTGSASGTGSGSKVSATASSPSATSEPESAGAAHNLAGMGIAAAAIALVL